MFISRPSAKQWSSILGISRPSSMEWSLIFMCFHIEALCKSNGHGSFISRPSTKAMVIDLSYHDPLRWNNHWFSCAFTSRPYAKAMVIDLSYQSPLQTQWSLIFYIKTFFDGMVINFHVLSYRGPLQKQWASIFHIKVLSDGMIIDFLNVCIDVVFLEPARNLCFSLFLSFTLIIWNVKFSYYLIKYKKRGAAVDTQFHPGK